MRTIREIEQRKLWRKHELQRDLRWKIGLEKDHLSPALAQAKLNYSLSGVTIQWWHLRCTAQASGCCVHCIRKVSAWKLAAPPSRKIPFAGKAAKSLARR
jgi:hypothetical protein